MHPRTGKLGSSSLDGGADHRGAGLQRREPPLRVTVPLKDGPGYQGFPTRNAHGQASSPRPPIPAPQRGGEPPGLRPGSLLTESSMMTGEAGWAAPPGAGSARRVQSLALRHPRRSRSASSRLCLLVRKITGIKLVSKEERGSNVEILYPNMLSPYLILGWCAEVSFLFLLSFLPLG